MQGLPLELHTLASAHWSPAALLPFLGFGLSMFAFYSLVPYQLQWGGAALLNLSLLTSDLWTALARLLLFGACFGRCGAGRRVPRACTRGRGKPRVWNEWGQGISGARRGRCKLVWGWCALASDSGLRS